MRGIWECVGCSSAAPGVAAATNRVSHRMAVDLTNRYMSHFVMHQFVIIMVECSIMCIR